MAHSAFSAYAGAPALQFVVTFRPAATTTITPPRIPILPALVEFSSACAICFPAKITAVDFASPFTPYVCKSRIRVNPRLGKIDDKLFRVLPGLEAVGQAPDAMGVPPTIPRPGDFGARGPLLVTLVLRCEGDDQSIIVVKVCHRARNYRQLVMRLPTIDAFNSVFRLQSARGNFQHTRRAKS